MGTTTTTRPALSPPTIRPVGGMGTTLPGTTRRGTMLAITMETASGTRAVIAITTVGAAITTAAGTTPVVRIGRTTKISVALLNGERFPWCLKQLIKKLNIVNKSCNLRNFTTQKNTKYKSIPDPP